MPVGPTKMYYTLSYVRCHNGDMAQTITFRPDEQTAVALAQLTRDGTAVSTAVRRAVIDAAHAQAQNLLRAEAATLAADDEDRTESSQVLKDMETLRAW